MRIFFIQLPIYCVLFSQLLFAREITNYLFDFGTRNSPVEEGFTRISEGDLYSTVRGYGWIRKPQQSFDNAAMKPVNVLLRDGVSATGRLVYRIDVPAGSYFLTVGLGATGSDSCKAVISANGKIISDTIAIPWLRLTYRVIRKKIVLKQSYIEVEIQSQSTTISMRSIELRPLTDLRPIQFFSELDSDTAQVAALATQLKTQLSINPSNLAAQNQLNLLEKYLLANYYYDIGWWSWAVKKTGLSIFNRFHIASDLLRQILANKNDPLYYRSAFLLGKIHYWLYLEQHRDYDRMESYKFFNLVKKKYPQHILLRMYCGENILHHCSYVSNDESAPVWAKKQNEAISRMLEIIHWWVGNRQVENGEMGGKFGDDVEMLRWWLPLILGADDTKARQGYYRLVEGVWNSGLLKRAYSRNVEDVEHAAELFTDTHTAMVLLEYGNPVYIERIFQSMQNFRDVWSSINEYGHRHFKSCYFSADQVIETAPQAVDVPMNARATLPGLWAAWYNRNPTLMQLFSEWGKAWVEDAMRTDKGKPQGILPAAVRFDNDEIGGYADSWYAPRLGWHYYNWIHVGAIMEMYNQLLGSYLLTGDPILMEPIYQTFAIAEKSFSTDDRERIITGSQEWVNRVLNAKIIDSYSSRNHFASLISRVKILTETSKFDAYLSKYGEDYTKYVVTNDKSNIISGCDKIIDDLKYNFPLRTSEVKFTDRVYVTYADHLFAMYTGGNGYGKEYPGTAVTWKNTGAKVSILVTHSNTKSTKIICYNFGESKTVQANFWRLEEGRYNLISGIDFNSDDKIDTLSYQNIFEVAERGAALRIELPTKQLFIIELSQIEKYKNPLSLCGDVAISENDISFESVKAAEGDCIQVDVKIHNIGNLDIQEIDVELYIDDLKISDQKIERIEAPNDLNPRWQIVSFTWPAERGTHRIKIDARIESKEITKRNNSAARSIRVH